MDEPENSIEHALTSNIKRRGRCSNKRDKRLSEAKHHVKGKRWSEAKKLEAITYYMVLGNLEKVEAFTGVPKSTIHVWKGTEWWQEGLRQVRTEQNDEVDSAMTEIMHKALGKISTMVDDGEIKRDNKTGEFYNLPVGIKDLSIASAIMFDKRQLLRGQATQRIEKVTVDQRLDDMALKFKQFSSATEIEGELIEDDTPNE